MHMQNWRMEAKNNVLELHIYDTVESSTWYKKSETSAQHFREQLAQHGNVSEIKIYINSLGGSVMEGIAIYNQLKRHPAHKTVYIDGFACSVASVIAMAGDTVIMPKNTVMMIHNAWAVAAGNAAELRKTADDLDVINRSSKQAYLEKAGEKLTEEELTRMLDAETYLTAEQCIAYGLADRYANDAAEPDSSGAKQTAGMLAQQAVQDEMYRRRERALAALETYFNH